MSLKIYLYDFTNRTIGMVCVGRYCAIASNGSCLGAQSNQMSTKNLTNKNAFI